MSWKPRSGFKRTVSASTKTVSVGREKFTRGAAAIQALHNFLFRSIAKTLLIRIEERVQNVLYQLRAAVKLDTGIGALK